MTIKEKKCIIIGRGVGTMINCFKKTKTLYWFVVVPVIAAMIFVVPFFAYKPSVFFIGSLLVHFISVFLLQRLALKEYMEKSLVLDEKCDAVAYRDFQLEIISHKLKGLYRLMVQMNLATAYYYCGDFFQMKRILEEMDMSRISNRAMAYLYSYYRLWFLYYNTLSNMPEAEKALEQLDSLPLPSDERQRRDCEYMIKMSHLTLECKKSQVPHIEEKMQMLRISDRLLSIVCEKNFLGRYYLRNGMRDKAKECFEFVAENGNTLFIARAAREILEESFNKGEE